jgi:glycosyltransferase involved in cell wall biosynthesis
MTEHPTGSPGRIGDAVETTAIVVSHNHEAFIAECLASIHAQTTPPTRVVLVDDGSSDRSFEIGSTLVEQYFPDHRLIAHPQPVGLCRSLNEGLAESRGEFLHEIAADDYWLSNKTELQLGVFARSPADTVVVFGDAQLIDADGVRLPGTFLERFIPDGLPPDDQLFRYLLRRNVLPAMSTLIRRSALLEVGGWDEDLFYEDWDMWLRLADRWRFVHHPDTVAAYRYLATSMSNARADEMWLSKLAISRKWAGRSVRADAGALVRPLGMTCRAALRGDWRYAGAWWRLLVAIVRRSGRQGRSLTPRPPVDR